MRTATQDREIQRHAQRERGNGLPVSLPPRGLSRTEAAAYVGVGVTTLDRLIRDGLMPKPLKVYGRRLWDRLRLDAAFAALADDNEEARAGDIWDHCAA